MLPYKTQKLAFPLTARRADHSDGSKPRSALPSSCRFHKLPRVCPHAVGSDPLSRACESHRRSRYSRDAYSGGSVPES